MTNELLPCPFCGGEAQIMQSPDGFTSVGCANDGCPTEHMVFPLMFSSMRKDVAVELWNTRYKRTCHKVPGKMHYGERRPKCSECGYSLGDSRWFYCPQCGAEICGAEVVDG